MNEDPGDAGSPADSPPSGIDPRRGARAGGGGVSRGGGPTPAQDGFVPVLRSDLGCTLIADHLVLHDAASHHTHVLNPTSMRIWAAIDGRRTTEDIGWLLTVESGADPVVVGHDVTRALEQFAAAEILHSPAPSADPVPDLDIAQEHVSTSTPDASTPSDASATPAATAASDADLSTPPRPRPGTYGGEAPPFSLAPRWALGASIVVRTDDPALADLISTILGAYHSADAAEHVIDVVRVVAGDSDSGGGFLLMVDGVADGEVREARDAVELVVSHFNRLAVAHTPDRLLLHAGVVERDGRAVVVVGPSGRGKSTLTAALVLAGFAYITDEVAAIDPTTGWVDPFPKPLSISNATCDLLGLSREPGSEDEPPQTKHAVAPGVLGSVSGGGHAALVVLLDDPAPTAPPLAGHAQPDAPPAVTDFLAMLEQTFAETMVIPDALEHLGRLYRDTPVLRLPRQELGASVRAVTAALT